MTPYQKNLEQILMTPFELLRAAQGHPMTTRIHGGPEVCVRVPTVDEMTVMIRAAQSSLPADIRPEMPSREAIARLVQPYAEAGES